jgi:hypothetical protein
MTETTTYQLSADEPTSTAVVECVAEANGVDPCSLDARLYDHVDPDALDSLFNTEGQGAIDVTVSFRMAGCRVTVDDTGTVSVTYTEGVDAAAPSALS